jgi:hypothetical protein
MDIGIGRDVTQGHLLGMAADDPGRAAQIRGVPAIPWGLWDAEGVRLMPLDVADQTYKGHADVYRGMFADCPPATPTGGSALVITACRNDGQVANELENHGLFTEYLLQVWDHGNYSGARGYAAFTNAIASAMPANQKAMLYASGPEDPDFRGQTPFTI